MMVAATRQVHGPESMGIVAATGCNSVYGATYPFNPYLVPYGGTDGFNVPGLPPGVVTAGGPVPVSLATDLIQAALDADGGAS